MRETLSDREIRRRLQQLRNYERLYPALRRKYETLHMENRMLRKKVREQQRTIETLLLRVEQLETIVFGARDDRAQRRRERREDEGEEGQSQPRSTASYRRRTPREEEVTTTMAFPLECCPDCGGPLLDRATITRYIEDILLPLDGQSLKQVEKRCIECGYCDRCKKKVSAIPYGTQECALGENVKMVVPYAVTILGQSHEKVRSWLHDVFGLDVSHGEITAILHEQRRRLLPREQEIEARIRDGPASHYDESGWPVQAEEQGRFGWVKTASHSEDTLFRLGRTRGKGNAEELRGEDTGQPAITDDFGSYDHLFVKHGLCWAHPRWKFRDLARSAVLSQRKRERCAVFSAAFKALFSEVRIIVHSPYNRKERLRKARTIGRRIAVLCAPRRGDPPTLATLKATFLENTEKYLLCVREKDVPMTNNKAERAIRPLVIKRKISFGSRTQKGAQTMETLLSVLFSLWWRKPENFFQEYRRLLQPV